MALPLAGRAEDGSHSRIFPSRALPQGEGTERGARRMLKLILQRLLQMALIMVVVSLVLFVVFDSPKFKKQLAVNELGGFAVATLTDSDYQKWLDEEGAERPDLRALRQMGVGPRPRRFRRVLPEERRRRLSARPRADQDRHPGLLGLRADDPAGAYHRRARRHTRGQGPGSRDHLHLGALHIDPGDRDGDHPDRLPGARPALAAGEIEGRRARSTSCCRC